MTKNKSYNIDGICCMVQNVSLEHIFNYLMKCNKTTPHLKMFYYNFFVVIPKNIFVCTYIKGRVALLDFTCN